LYPCNVCAGLIAQSGLRRVITPKIANERWQASNEMARLIFAEAGVEVVEV
jgi:deoxycytidylate deaminase